MPGILGRALLKNSDTLARDVSTGLRKKIMSNEGWSFTSGELINSFMAEGLSRAGYGAVGGAGLAWMTGGSPIEGAKQGAFYGAGYGTLRHMSANRSALARRAFGVDTGQGFFSGFRATQRVNEMARAGRGELARAATAADRVASRATSAEASAMREIASLRRQPGATQEVRQAALNRYREAAAEWSGLGGTISNVNARTMASERRINYLARRMGLGE